LVLAREAFVAGDEQVADDRVCDSGLPASKLSALGVTPAP
jgi:hypothetical protein